MAGLVDVVRVCLVTAKAHTAREVVANRRRGPKIAISTPILRHSLGVNIAAGGEVADHFVLIIFLKFITNIPYIRERFPVKAARSYLHMSFVPVFDVLVLPG